MTENQRHPVIDGADPDFMIDLVSALSALASLAQLGTAWLASRAVTHSPHSIGQGQRYKSFFVFGAHPQHGCAILVFFADQANVCGNDYRKCLKAVIQPGVVNS